MPNRVWRALFVCLAVGSGAFVAYSQDDEQRTIRDITIRDYVLEDEWKEAGLDRLTERQARALDGWFRDYTLHCYRSFASNQRAGMEAPAPPRRRERRYDGVMGEGPDQAHRLRERSGLIVRLEDGSRWEARRRDAALLRAWALEDEIYVVEASKAERRRFGKFSYKLSDPTRGPGFLRVKFRGY